MIIDSPVGRFPFTVTSVSLRKRDILLRGRMGTWPATVEAVPSDIPAVIGRVSPALAVILGSAALLLVGVGVAVGALWL
ncbi:hypothetical protein [Streptomyces sp. NPDC000880]